MKECWYSEKKTLDKSVNFNWEEFDTLEISASCSSRDSKNALNFLLLTSNWTITWLSLDQMQYCSIKLVISCSNTWSWSEDILNLCFLVYFRHFFFFFFLIGSDSILLEVLLPSLAPQAGKVWQVKANAGTISPFITNTSARDRQNIQNNSSSSFIPF